MYSHIADIWDKLAADIDHAGLAEYLGRLFALLGASPDSVVDLGCGTGSLCVEMFRRGHDVTGIDISPEMLARARDKAAAAQAGERILLLNQDITAFELYGTVNAMVCVSDVVNHVTSPAQLDRLFRLAKNYLDPGGIFVFDINTPYKFRHVFANSTYYHAGDDFAYIWQNTWKPGRGICVFDLTCFAGTGRGGLYTRFDETIRERAYNPADLDKRLLAAGLEPLGHFGDRKLTKPAAKEQRIFIAARRPA